MQPTTSYLIDHQSSTKLTLRRISSPVYHEQYASDDVESLFGEDSDNYVPSENEISSDSEINSTPTKKEKKRQRSPSPKNEISPPEDKENRTPTKKGKKRVRNPKQWKKIEAKLLKNSGKSYISRTGKVVNERRMGPTCGSRCILKCSEKLSEERRAEFFQQYWSLGSLQRQRDYLSSCIEPLQLSYRRISTNKEPRRQNCAFCLLHNGKRIRVCKTYLTNTFGIKERTIRTVIQSRTSESGIVAVDKRGKHGNQSKMNPEVMESIKSHINSIPRIESHYQRANTSREFIDGGLSIAAMHRHYKSDRASMGQPAANYDAYARVFNTEFNIGFFCPKKDQCDFCESFKNSNDEEKEELQSQYESHQEEKELSRTEKAADKEKVKDQGSKTVLAMYDLQAVLPVPMGQTSAFFYKSRLNCFNFTV